jgi:hypothetical protein
MEMIDKLRIAGEQAAASARETLHESQLRNDLSRAYAELGRAAYGLLERGAITDERLGPHAEHVRALERDLARVQPSTPRVPAGPAAP